MFFSTDASVSKGKARPVLARVGFEGGAEKFSCKSFTVRLRGVNAARSAQKSPLEGERK
jgi:hypothetical protein